MSNQTICYKTYFLNFTSGFLFILLKINNVNDYKKIIILHNTADGNYLKHPARHNCTG